MRTILSLTVVLAVILCTACGPDVPPEPPLGQDAGAVISGFNFQSNFGWGTIQAGQTLTSHTGPGPGFNPTSVTCYTQKLPDGINFDCWAEPAPSGAVVFRVKNTNTFSVVLGVKWHGMIWQ